MKCVACVSLPFMSETREGQRDSSRDGSVGSFIYSLALSLAHQVPSPADRFSLACYPTVALASHILPLLPHTLRGFLFKCTQFTPADDSGTSSGP